MLLTIEFAYCSLAQDVKRYGVEWPGVTDAALIEARLYTAGGYMTLSNGMRIGDGKLAHFKRLIKELCPWFAFHTFSEMIVDAWVHHDTIGVAGPASTGKTYSAAMCAYAEFFCRPRGTSIIMSSIDLKGLRLRVWGAIVEILKRVHERRPEAPGYLVPSEIRIYPQEPTDEEKNDPRDAIMGVACKQGDQWVGIGCFPEGTLVDTPSGPISIENVLCGCRVLNRSGVGFVTATIRKLADSFVRITIRDGDTIECTTNHEILAVLKPYDSRLPDEMSDCGGEIYIRADALRLDDELACGQHGAFRTEVTRLEHFKTEPRIVYDLQISNDHSYSVHGVIVHNSYVGLKNDQVIGVFDESSLMSAGFWDAIANLRKNPRTKFVALGNPKDYYDALGKICEPAPELGGWEGLKYSEHSRTWKTRGTNGIAVQLSGLDTPNGIGADGRPCPGLNRYPYLITPEHIEEDKQLFGADTWQFQMMDLGVWPRGESSKRVITRAICESGNAFGEPNWDGVTPTLDYVGIDAAYSGVGGDRSALIRIRSGNNADGVPVIAVVDGPIIIPVDTGMKNDDGKTVPAEDQIAVFVKNYCEKHNVPASRVGYDSTGRGSLAAAFARVWNPNTNAIEFGGLPPEERRVLSHDEKTERDAYGKMVSALWFAWRNLITMGQMRLLPTSVFEEGIMREFFITGAGKTDVEPKEKTVKRMGRSPDLADALVVAIEVARRNGFVVGKTVASQSAEQPKWLGQRRDKWRATIAKEVLNEA